MHKSMVSALAVTAACAVVSATGVSDASASRGPVPAMVTGQEATGRPQAPSSPGTRLWAARYSGPRGGWANSLAVSPGGGTVFVTGSSTGDYATVAYSAATGARMWAERYHGFSQNAATMNVANSVAVSPGGGTVFVTGSSARYSATAPQYYATVAYNATTGAQLWAARYRGPGNGADIAYSVAVSPTAGTVFVTGTVSAGAGTTARDYATVAYSAATGARMWVARYHGSGNGLDGARSIVVSPDGRTVFVTGTSDGSSGYDYATVAYDATTGAQLWVKRYRGENAGNAALSLAVSPNGGMVFVTGGSYRSTAGQDYATVAYSAATGAQLWVARYHGSGNGLDGARSVTVSPDSRTVFVTGTSYGGSRTQFDYATIAYGATTGAQLWVARYQGPGNGDDIAESVATSPSGGTVYVTGPSWGRIPGYDYATVAYNATTGAQLWVARYQGPGNRDNSARSVAVSPTGTVFVTGSSAKSITTPPRYFATVAYSG